MIKLGAELWPKFACNDKLGQQTEGRDGWQ